MIVGPTVPGIMLCPALERRDSEPPFEYFFRGFSPAPDVPLKAGPGKGYRGIRNPALKRGAVHEHGN